MKTLAQHLAEYSGERTVDRSALASAIAASQTTLVVLDDDPTGTQTVNDVPVLTTWEVDALVAELNSGTPIFFVLTNSRSLPVEDAKLLAAEIGRNLGKASGLIGRRIAVISRGDSTLRGHYPAEVDTLSDGLGDEFHATLIIPAFFEGGRYTIGDIHYVAQPSGNLQPAAETQFALDASFGYKSSNLREWVEEKTAGRTPASDVRSITLQDIRSGGPVQVERILTSLNPNATCIVNAASYADLEVFTLGLLRAESSGLSFLYRTAASFVAVRAGVERRPPLNMDDLELGSGGGLIVCGSHVPIATSQLNDLIESGLATHVQARVPSLLTEPEAEILRISRNADALLDAGKDVVISTSRELVRGGDHASSLAISKRVSNSLVDIVRRLKSHPRYVLAKGGITSSDTATMALGVRRATVLGQIRPGIPVWKLGIETRYPGLPYIIFPGNVGLPATLTDVVKQLRSEEGPLDK